MCISNIGNRRPFPTNGFKSRGAVPTSVTSSSIATGALKAALDTTAKRHQQQHPHLIVHHDYHDHAQDPRASYQEYASAPARGGVTTPFPLKLHSVLRQVEADGLGHVVSWQPHGRCFVVHDPKKFTELLPHYFKLSKLASFQRQLNLYGFQRLTRGKDRGGYYHELFLKDRVFLAHSIQRIKVKGTGVRARSNPNEEPNFWSMPFVDAMSKHRSVSCCSSSSESSSSTSASPVPSSPLQQDNEDPLHNNTGLPGSFFSQQFPLHLEPTAMQEHDEVLFGKHFFGVDQDDSIVKKAPLPPPQNLDQQLLEEDIDAFFEDFDFPDDIGNEIEDDVVFGELLEQMIA